MDRTELERAFLHDLSNPLAVAQGLIETALEEIRNRPEDAANQLQRLERVRTALVRIGDLLQTRREAILRNPASR